ncbi:hypothetical protein K0M31_020053, partial [Melipona bicolor]
MGFEYAEQRTVVRAPLWDRCIGVIPIDRPMSFARRMSAYRGASTPLQNAGATSRQYSAGIANRVDLKNYRHETR